MSTEKFGQDPPAEADEETHLAAKGQKGQHRKDFSAGGVVVHEGDVIVIVPRRRGNQGGTVLGLPKGHLDGDETEVEAATREVREETGVVAEPVAKLGEIRYSYERRGRPIDKRVVL
jgi:8-oxo-dGTP pyrophosphatase MutT (NUDIX family)